MVKRILPDCERLDFHKPAKEVRNFTWNVFADHILEMLKGRCFNSDGMFTEHEQKSAWFALHETLAVILRALAPITPFLTEKVYRELYGEDSIHREPFPSSQSDYESELTDYTTLLQAVNGGFWGFKRENGISLREGLSAAYIPRELTPWGKDLQAMHGVESLKFGKPDDDSYAMIDLPEREAAIYILPPAQEK
jgi:valyl-tRNA synthetase